MEIVGLRGYENSALTPYTYTADGRADYARAYNKYTMEIRYPFILKPSSTIYGLVFAEGGNAFKSWKEFDPFLIKRRHARNRLGIRVRQGGRTDRT